MISCQFALYPLGVDHLTPAIESAIGELRRSGLEPEPGPMSSYVVGGSQAVFDGLGVLSMQPATGGTWS
jgi:hypothetical protein